MGNMMEKEGIAVAASRIRNAVYENRFFIDDRYFVFLEYDKGTGKYKVIYLTWTIIELMASLPDGGDFHGYEMDDVKERHKYFIHQVSVVWRRMCMG